MINNSNVNNDSTKTDSLFGNFLNYCSEVADEVANTDLKIGKTVEEFFDSPKIESEQEAFQENSSLIDSFLGYCSEVADEFESAVANARQKIDDTVEEFFPVLTNSESKFSVQYNAFEIICDDNVTVIDDYFNQESINKQSVDEPSDAVDHYLSVIQEEIDDGNLLIPEASKSIFSMIIEFFLEIYLTIQNWLFPKELKDSASIASTEENSSNESFITVNQPPNNTIDPSEQQPIVFEKYYVQYDTILSKIPSDEELGLYAKTKLILTLTGPFYALGVTDPGAFEQHVLNLMAVACDDTHKETTAKLVQLNRDNFIKLIDKAFSNYPEQPYFQEQVAEFATRTKLNPEMTIALFQNKEWNIFLDQLGYTARG